MQPIGRLARSRERETLVTPRQRGRRPFATATRIGLSLRRPERVNKEMRKRRASATSAETHCRRHGEERRRLRARSAREARSAAALARRPASRDARRLAVSSRPATSSPCSSSNAPQVAIASQTAMTPPRCHRDRQFEAIRRAGAAWHRRCAVRGGVGLSSARNRSRPWSSQGSRTHLAFTKVGPEARRPPQRCAMRLPHRLRRLVLRPRRTHHEFCRLAARSAVRRRRVGEARRLADDGDEVPTRVETKCSAGDSVPESRPGI